jgi:hypothetical protein
MAQFYTTSIETYLNDPNIGEHKDRRLALCLQLLATAQGQVASAYWNSIERHNVTGSEMVTLGAQRQGYTMSAKKYLQDVLAILDTI